MSNHTTKKVDKLLVKLLIINFYFFSISVTGFSQIKSTDTIAFKKDLQQLLIKYNIKKGYLFNVISVNQKGGQTAFVINNNYFVDSVNNETNIGGEIDSINKKLYVYPKKGVWLSAFVATDTANEKHNYYDYKKHFPRARITAMKCLIKDTIYIFNGYSTTRSSSEVVPIEINLALDSSDIFVFGDYLDRNKRYLYIKGGIYWFPRQGFKTELF